MVFLSTETESRSLDKYREEWDEEYKKILEANGRRGWAEETVWCSPGLTDTWDYET